MLDTKICFHQDYWRSRDIVKVHVHGDEIPQLSSMLNVFESEVAI